jgi:hypothetical protein
MAKIAIVGDGVICSAIAYYLALALLPCIDALDPQFNAFLLPTPEKAREQAKASEREIRRKLRGRQQRQRAPSRTAQPQRPGNHRPAPAARSAAAAPLHRLGSLQATGILGTHAARALTSRIGSRGARAEKGACE